MRSSYRDALTVALVPGSHSPSARRRRVLAADLVSTVLRPQLRTDVGLDIVLLTTTLSEEGVGLSRVGAGCVLAGPVRVGEVPTGEIPKGAGE
jgi:hypothetical protein